MTGQFDHLAPALRAIVARQLALFPKHAPFLQRRFASTSAAEQRILADLSGKIGRLIGDRLDEFCADYDFLTGIVLEEELHFRRTGRYRLTSFEEANRLVYQDVAYMRRYMNGLLLTQLYWSNHTATFDYFVQGFLDKAEHGSRLVEIGPGHGLLLAYAAAHDNCAKVEGWDISPASLAGTADALSRLGASAELVEASFFDVTGSEGAIDLLVFAEVLEHMEDPLAAIRCLRRLLKPGGRLFLHVPVNSPAPDHLFLLETPEAALDLLREEGFEIESHHFLPATNSTLADARRLKLTISVALVARRGST
jgi:2-polyprenyl-3-methyl-5-hydroxy-6-metoxy-1,4-benzoquinol methylase